MGVLSDRQIEAEGIVTPFEPGVKRPGVVGYGSSAYGHDLRIGYKFKVAKSPHFWAAQGLPYPVLDPKGDNDTAYEDIDLTPPDPALRWQVVNGLSVCGRCSHMADRPEPHTYNGRLCPNTDMVEAPPRDYLVIAAGAYALGEPLETLHIPRSVLAQVTGKSTYTRLGLLVNCTPLEPEWTGKVTMTLANLSPLPVKVYCGEGIAQVVFTRSDDPRLCRVSYADKGGKYQAAPGIQTAKVDGV